MRRLTAWVGLGCGLALLLVFFRAALFGGEQFAFRDAAHYYYPLYLQVQREWQAGRWPLWDPGENAGMPLLGNPTAAVLYPGKLIYAALPYAWAARAYAIAHTALAFAGMLVLMRSWGTSWAGSSMAALAYGFGGPIVFQYCNIIFLVGAAWAPWGLLAVDRWLRLGRRWAVPALAGVLAMQVLGGDPEGAYLVGLCAGGYAAGLAWAARRGARPFRAGLWVPIVGGALVAWVVITLLLAVYLPGFRPEPNEKPWGPLARWVSSGKIPRFRPDAFDGPVPGVLFTRPFHLAVTGAWALAGLALLARWRRRGSAGVPLVPKLAGLAAAAALAGAISAAQLLPVVEFTGLTGRSSDEGAHDIYPFSLEPYRLAEAVWPGFYGRRFGLPVTWGDLITPTLNHRVWVPTLYLGGSTIVLALAAAGFRGGPPWRAWLTAIAAVGLIGSFGEFASPLTIARFVPAVRSAIGPHDSHETNAVRLDGYLRDGDGSPYYLMSELLPGFQQFRFPSKLLTFVALAVAGLAGIGWDRVARGVGSTKVARLGAIGAVVSLGLLLIVIVARGAIAGRLQAANLMTIFGPLDVAASVADLRNSLAQGAIALATVAGLAILAGRRGELAGLLAVLTLAIDVGLVNHAYIKTAPQADFEKVPKVVEVIREAERIDPSPGPFRVHRMPIWNPPSWRINSSTDRIRDFVRWEHETIQPKYGLLHGVEYTSTIGVAELYDYSWFFSPFPWKARADAARMLNVPLHTPIAVYPRRGFDLWNSRYFILPGVPSWPDADRGIASFLPQTRQVYPPREILSARGDDPKARHWLEEEDFQIVRNLDAFPRAWVVHQSRFKPPVAGLTRRERKETMEEIVFSNDPFWPDPTRAYHEAKNLAWIEIEDTTPLAGYLPGGPPLAGESATVVVEESGPQRVVLIAKLARPGLVILADVFYPGWALTIDDQPAPIYRANRLMRGAAVGAGRHRLVYTYDPRSFKLGMAISGLGLVAMIVATATGLRRRAG